MLSKAVMYATTKHDGQYRKVSNLPYIVHPMEVMKRVSSYGITDTDILSAAVLHDVIEDCNVTYKEIKSEFNKSVADIVLECSRGESENKVKFLKGFETKSVQSIIIKIADRFCNVHDYISDGNEKYSIKYANQAEPLYIFMTDGRTLHQNYINNAIYKKITTDISILRNLKYNSTKEM
jgi:(p)ppGpp synthase/HD superfamily hydrolase